MRRVGPETVDRILAASLVVVAQIELWVGHVSTSPKWLATPLFVLIPGLVAVRRRAPVPVGSAIVVAQELIFVTGNSTSVALAIAWMCGMYGIAVWTDTRGFLLGLGALVAGNWLGYAAGGADPKNTVLFTVIPGVVMYLLRRTIRDRELRAQLLELQARDAVAEERARIARELHDLVAHNVSVMVVQAGAERHALAPGQESTRAALTSIEQSGRQALAEARRLLGVLRHGDDGEELQPQPGVARIGELVEQTRRAGLPVELAIEGEPVPLPAGIDLCAYRIVQEGLTNALKHAGPAHARVRLRYAPARLAVEVTDDGPGAVNGERSGDEGRGGAGDEPQARQTRGRGAGHGLIGMRERVALYGGRIEAGPRPEGGFGVHAELPLT
jgi:signal transduction histidine kinase